MSLLYFTRANCFKRFNFTYVHHAITIVFHLNKKNLSFFTLPVSLWNDLSHHGFDGVGLDGFKSRVKDFLFAVAVRSLFAFYCFPFLFFLSLGLVLLAWGLWNDGV